MNFERISLLLAVAAQCVDYPDSKVHSTIRAAAMKELEAEIKAPAPVPAASAKTIFPPDSGVQETHGVETARRSL